MEKIKRKSINQRRWREKKKIRKMRSEGYTYEFIAKKFKGKISTIAKIAKDVELRPEFQRRVTIAEKNKITKTS